MTPVAIADEKLALDIDMPLFPAEFSCRRHRDAVPPFQIGGGQNIGPASSVCFESTLARNALGSVQLKSLQVQDAHASQNQQRPGRAQR